MKTKSFKISEVNQKWLLIDAENKTLGRLSSRVSSILMGKNKSQYTPNNDLGDFVVIINAEKIKDIYKGTSNEFSQSVALNAAAGLIVAGKENDFKNAYKKASDHLNSGKVFEHLTKLQSK